MTAERTPDRLFGELFELVQASHVFADSKTFVDATPRSDPGTIMRDFERARERPDFDLETFVRTHFELPPDAPPPSDASASVPVDERIEALWDLLTRKPDVREKHSSLIPLPNAYVVPGGRFREVYYWDSYFTMLGLADSGRVGLIEDMVENFAYLIEHIGFVPNGNRSYYCTRSQPPYFSLMVELLAEVSNDSGVRTRFQPQLFAEYQFWMADGGETEAHRRLVNTAAGPLNRYWDDSDLPRQESHAEDLALAAKSDRDASGLFRDVRAACESGWDFSSRWFEDGKRMDTIRTTDIVPVDLNALIYNLERMLAAGFRAMGRKGESDLYRERAERRRHLLQTKFWDEESGMFVDLRLPDLEPTGTLSLASAYPLFFGIATSEQAERVAGRLNGDFLKAGGWVTTLVETGQQWDLPNGWAPMQWITYAGLERYGFDDEARNGAIRWVDNNLDAYRHSGRLLEKYDVVAPGGAGRGGEYTVQDGFGWTNAVLLRFMKKLGMLA